MPVDAPSPTPSNPNPTAPKRARTNAANAAARNKRARKAEGSMGPDSGAEGSRRPMSFGVGMVKGREEEWSEPADIKTKVCGGEGRERYWVVAVWSRGKAIGDRRQAHVLSLSVRVHSLC